jgi:hypothetical protein
MFSSRRAKGEVARSLALKLSCEESFTKETGFSMIVRRYVQGYRDGAKDALRFLSAQLHGSRSGMIEKELIYRWLDRVDKRVVNKRKIIEPPRSFE